MARPDLHIVVIGYGLVGKELVTQILSNKDCPIPSCFQQIKLLGVARSNGIQYAESVSEGFKRLEQINLENFSERGSALDLDAVLKRLLSLGQRCAIVDCTSSEKVAAHYVRWLSAGVSVVTPNKKAFSASLEYYRELSPFLGSGDGRATLMYESTVGAGLPIISTINRILQTGDRVEEIEGVFSGTLSFLFNRFSPICPDERSESFSALVAEAKALGCTEPDPRDDLNGSDVARKMTICARLCGLQVSLEDIPTESLVPLGIANAASPTDFLEKLPQFDAQLNDRNARARERGKVLRYVGSLDLQAQRVKVGLVEVSQSDPLARLVGSDNMICIRTKNFPQKLIVQGAGAGASVTAFGVYSDLLGVVERASLPC